MKVIFVAIHRKTNDIPEYFREEAELVIPSYGYFIRGAQTTFTGVLRFVVNICLLTSDPLKQLFGSRITSNMDENLSQPSWRKRPPGPMRTDFIGRAKKRANNEVVGFASAWLTGLCLCLVSEIGSGSTSCAEWPTLTVTLKIYRLWAASVPVLKQFLLMRHVLLHVNILILTLCRTDTIHVFVHVLQVCHIMCTVIMCMIRC